MKIMLAGAAALLATSAGAGAQVYSQNFDAGTTGFTGGTYAVTPSGQHYLELGQGAAATLSVATAGYTALSLSFNLYGLRSVDGNGQYGGGPDNFLIYLNGSTTAAYTLNIADFQGNTQSFNGDLTQIRTDPNNGYAARTGAIANNTLGYGDGSDGFGDSTYLISFTLPDTAVTSIRFVGTTTEDLVDPNGSASGNEAYGIDNVSLTGRAVVNGAVPEPASWAMMIGGFGLAGGALRRRRMGATFAVA